MIHPSAEVSPAASIGEGTRVWHEAQVREGARVGRWCILGKGVYVDKDVVIGDRVKIQNHASIYRGCTVEDDAFIGPNVVLANDRFPRSVTLEGELKSDTDWQVSGVTVKHGASLGAGAIVLPGVTVGRFALVGAGSVVVQDVPDHGLVVGNPARLRGYACRCGRKLPDLEGSGEHRRAGQRRVRCAYCGTECVF